MTSCLPTSTTATVRFLLACLAEMEGGTLGDLSRVGVNTPLDGKFEPRIKDGCT